jgi:hypothetical protein
MATSERSIVARRAAVQQVTRSAFREPAELVAWMGAVQAQDPLGARWALGLRLAGRPGEAAIVRALAEGTILRTHVMRWTWQLVTPADLRWMLPLVSARLVARAARRHRELALDASTLRRAHAALAGALDGGAHLTRAELAAALRAAGIDPGGPRLSHLLGHAELHGIVCSGAPRGKQPTWALLDARAPAAGAPLARQEALAELARRYFTSRGPATARDFAWWSGLAPAEARAGIAGAGAALAQDVIDGVVHWQAPQPPAATRAALDDAYLLPAFDEYLVAYQDRSAMLDPRHARHHNAGGGMLSPVVVVGGRVVGTWRRTLARKGVTVSLALFETPAAGDRARIAAAAERYGAFLGLEAEIEGLTPRTRKDH